MFECLPFGCKNKFGISVTVDPQHELADVKKQLWKAAEDAYREREVRYPLEAALNTFAMRSQDNSSIVLSPDIATWLANRFHKPELAETLLSSEKLDFEPVFAASRADISEGEERLKTGFPNGRAALCRCRSNPWCLAGQR